MVAASASRRSPFWSPRRSGPFSGGLIGIVLSSPLIVCLVVMGNYIPFLSFLDILLGDGPALTPDIVYYQRLLVRNREEQRGRSSWRAPKSRPCNTLSMKSWCRP